MTSLRLQLLAHAPLPATLQAALIRAGDDVDIRYLTDNPDLSDEAFIALLTDRRTNGRLRLITSSTPLTAEQWNAVEETGDGELVAHAEGCAATARRRRPGPAWANDRLRERAHTRPLPQIAARRSRAELTAVADAIGALCGDDPGRWRVALTLLDAVTGPLPELLTVLEGTLTEPHTGP